MDNPQAWVWPCNPAQASDDMVKCSSHWECNQRSTNNNLSSRAITARLSSPQAPSIRPDLRHTPEGCIYGCQPSNLRESPKKRTIDRAPPTRHPPRSLELRSCDPKSPPCVVDTRATFPRNSSRSYSRRGTRCRTSSPPGTWRRVGTGQSSVVILRPVSAGSTPSSGVSFRISRKI